MTEPFRPGWSPVTRLRAGVQALLHRRLWRLDIGPGCRIHPDALIDRTWPRGIHIGEECLIDAWAVVLTHDFTRGLLVDTWIGDRCRIGARAIIMPGVKIGAGSIVHPGAVVTRDMPDGTQALGNPAAITPAGADVAAG